MLRSRLLPALLLLFLSSWTRLSFAQENAQGWKYELYGGYNYLSNSFSVDSNFSGTGLNGWDVSLTKRHLFRGLGLEFAANGHYGTTDFDTQIEHSLLVGPQYAKRFGKESVFVHGLIGIGFINNGSIPGDVPGPTSNVVLAGLAGGGLDTPISRRLAWRVEADWLHSQYSPKDDQIHGLQGNFASISTGLVLRF